MALYGHFSGIPGTDFFSDVGLLSKKAGAENVVFRCSVSSFHV